MRTPSNMYRWTFTKRKKGKKKESNSIREMNPSNAGSIEKKTPGTVTATPQSPEIALSWNSSCNPLWSMKWMIVTCVALTLFTLRTGIEWLTSSTPTTTTMETATVTISGSRPSLPVSDVPPTHSEDSRVITTLLPWNIKSNSNSTTTTTTLIAPKRNVIVVQSNFATAETILKYFFNAGCFTMRDRGMRNACKAQVPDTQLDTIIRNVIYLYHPRWRVTGEATTILWNLRHPVDHLVAWYYYFHPHRCIADLGMSRLQPPCQVQREAENHLTFAANFFIDCFPTLPQLAQIFRSIDTGGSPSIEWNFHDSTYSIPPDIILSTPRSGSSNTMIVDNGTTNAYNYNFCYNLAHNLIRGGVVNDDSDSKNDNDTRKNFTANLAAMHITANLRYYDTYTQGAAKEAPVFQNKETWLIRTEHIRNDLETLEKLLEGDGDGDGRDGSDPAFSWEYGENITRPMQPFLRQYQLPSAMTRIFCCVLQDELVVINHILARTGNMNLQQKHNAWMEVLQRCGYQSWMVFQTECERLIRN